MNPFVLGNILPGEPFCNRKKEMEELAHYAINCANVVIYSPAAMVKHLWQGRSCTNLQRRASWRFMWTSSP
jgi:hypothetical protein